MYTHRHGSGFGDELSNKDFNAHIRKGSGAVGDSELVSRWKGAA